MGIEVLAKIAQWFSWVSTISLSSEILALIGIVLISFVLVLYVSKGIIHLGKWLVNLKVKEFTLVLALIGITLIGIAIILP